MRSTTDPTAGTAAGTVVYAGSSFFLVVFQLSMQKVCPQRMRNTESTCSQSLILKFNPLGLHSIFCDFGIISSVGYSWENGKTFISQSYTFYDRGDIRKAENQHQKLNNR